MAQEENHHQSRNVKSSNFSIEHILNKAGESGVKSPEFQWLQCSRYCPPKVPRIHKKDNVQKRQLGRHPRIPFTSFQLSVLEQKFKETPYLSSEDVSSVSKRLQLADIRVKIWFQNRRARERRERNCVSSTSHIKKESQEDVKQMTQVDDNFSREVSNTSQHHHHQYLLMPCFMSSENVSYISYNKSGSAT